MYELACPACNSSSQYDVSDYLLMCPLCSATFSLERETGHKEVYNDHFIVANSSNPVQVKALVLEWLRRLNHRQDSVDSEFFISDISGLSAPFWVVSVEAHTVWKGLVQRQKRRQIEAKFGSDYLIEQGQFKRNYRWAVSGRHNICESWGMTRLHEPKEPVSVGWDGFPLDSTFSRGQLQDAKSEKAAYESREFFDFKFSNGLAILGVQVSEEEAMRRAKLHVEQYHLELAKLNVDYLTDFRTEIEIAGIQLIHLPFWYASYVYKPQTMLRHFYKPKEKKLILEGYNSGVLIGQLPIHQADKIGVNATICAIATVVFLVFGLVLHKAFLLVALFSLVVAGISAYLNIAAKQDSGAVTSEANGQIDEADLAKVV
ncbi:MAG: hypothetical protein NTY08_05745 [Proteobacteria bacterium]|nr:hypothetical protein [Pseudomonadota bacterium]